MFRHWSSHLTRWQPSSRGRGNLSCRACTLRPSSSYAETTLRIAATQPRRCAKGRRRSRRRCVAWRPSAPGYCTCLHCASTRSKCPARSRPGEARPLAQGCPLGLRGAPSPQRSCGSVLLPVHVVDDATSDRSGASTSCQAAPPRCATCRRSPPSCRRHSSCCSAVWSRLIGWIDCCPPNMAPCSLPPESRGGLAESVKYQTITSPMFPCVFECSGVHV